MLSIKKHINNPNSKIESIKLTIFSKDIIEDAKKEFEKKKENGIIVEGSFDDDTWRLSNEVNTFKLEFNFNEIVFEREKKTRNIGTFEQFILACKTYFIFVIENNSVAGIRSKLGNLKKIMNETNYLSEQKISYIYNDEVNLYKYSVLINFLEFYEFEISDLVWDIIQSKYMAYLENETNRKNKKQRNLSSMESIFKFYECLDYFWMKATKEEKEEYYPLKIWWELSMRIPIRVTELLLTPLDCITTKNNNKFISIRRNNIKGYSDKKNDINKLESDYYIQKVPITDEIADYIEEYKDLVKEYDYIENFYIQDCKYNSNIRERKTLFSKRSYIKYLRNTPEYKNTDFIDSTIEMLTYGNLRYVLTRFYRYILIGRYNLKVIKKNTQEKLNYDEIEFINLLDTRHYAFINLVLNEVDPLIMMKYGGHNKVSSGYHYYQHVDKFVECYTYYMAKKIAIKEKSIEKTNTIKFDLESDDFSNEIFNKVFKKDKVKKEVQNGFCTSTQKNFEDCRLVDNNCNSCHYFEKGDNSVKEMIKKEIKENFDNIKLEVEELKYLIKNFNHLTDPKERIGLKINKIKSYSNENAHILSENLDLIDGKKVDDINE